MPYRLKTVRCAHPGGFHEMVYADWGREDFETVAVCVHGLTRNGRDFDRLAEVLSADGVRVLAPDIVGRGRSGRLGPLADYEIPQYIQDITTMLAAERLRSVDWIGTSMGGLIGMSVAAMAGTPIRRMLINDVGPLVPKAALERIGDYVGVAWNFRDFEQALDHIKKAYAPFGLTTEEDWRHLTEISIEPTADGGFTKAYDLRIADPFKNGEIADVDLWSVWDAISVPILVLRGAESDLLLPETAAEMARRGPRAEIVEIDGCGHAPALMDTGQIELVRKWMAE